jgi:histidine triad (HIT) family protein
VKLAKEKGKVVEMMDDCIFCKIIQGKIPCAKVYEDDNVFAFLDIGPVNKGHTLVVPKEHYRTFLETPDEVMQEIIVAGKKISKAIIKAVKADGINIGISTEKAAGQVIFHTHMHLMPRFANDGYKHWPQGKYADGEIEEFRKKIVDNL